MKKVNFNLWTVLAASVVISFSSCKKDKDEDSTPTPTVNKKIFIACEGQFGTGTGTVSSFVRETKAVANDLYGSVNGGAALGNIVQSMAIDNDKVYVVVNNANKIIVVNKNTFVYEDTIGDVEAPRFMIIKNNKAYVTEWTSAGVNGNVKVFELAHNTLQTTIPVGNGPDNLLELNGKIFVCNSGGFSSDSTISVIDVASNSVVQTINVGINPTGIAEDMNGKLWVVCNGNFGGNNGALVRFNPVTYAVEQTLPLGVDGYQIRLTTNRTKSNLFFNQYGTLKQVDVATATISTYVNRDFYSVACDPVEDKLLVTTAPAAANGWLIRYDLNTALPVDSFEVGIYPGSFCFE